MSAGNSRPANLTTNIEETKSSGGDTIVSSIQELHAELHSFLAVHTERLLALKGKCSPVVDIRTQRPASAVTFPEISPTIVSSPQEYSATSNKTVERHAKHLQDFLDSHMKSIELLRSSLMPRALNGQASPLMPVPQFHAQDKIFESLGSQFNMLVVISTFTASLIISFLSLVNSIIKDDHPAAFDMGMLMSFFAMSLHFGNIIVAGRGSALASQRASDSGMEYDLAYFMHYLGLCEQLQFFATVVFLVSVTELTFIMFHKLVYPLVLIGVVALGSFIVFWSAYWKVSMTFRNLMFLIQRARGLRVRARSHSISKRQTMDL